MIANLVFVVFAIFFSWAPTRLLYLVFHTRIFKSRSFNLWSTCKIISLLKTFIFNVCTTPGALLGVGYTELNKAELFHNS